MNKMRERRNNLASYRGLMESVLEDPIVQFAVNHLGAKITAVYSDLEELQTQPNDQSIQVTSSRRFPQDHHQIA